MRRKKEQNYDKLILILRLHFFSPLQVEKSFERLRRNESPPVLATTADATEEEEEEFFHSVAVLR